MDFSSNSLVIILIHGGVDHPESKRILDILDKEKVTQVTRIQVKSQSTKQWLTHNERGVDIKSIPSFLITRGTSTIVHHGDKIDQIIALIRRLVPSGTWIPRPDGE